MPAAGGCGRSPWLSAYRVILLPGIVLPAEPAYGALIAALGPDVEAVAKGLEIYATPEPPADYSLELEIAGVLREADGNGGSGFISSGIRAGERRRSRSPRPGRSGSRASRCSSPPGRETGT